jgi:hypothetical protein
VEQVQRGLRRGEGASLKYDGLDRLRVVTSTLFLNETYSFDTLGAPEG